MFFAFRPFVSEEIPQEKSYPADPTFNQAKVHGAVTRYLIVNPVRPLKCAEHLEEPC
jgi:hypothetical protein